MTTEPATIGNGTRVSLGLIIGGLSVVSSLVVSLLALAFVAGGWKQSVLEAVNADFIRRGEVEVLLKAEDVTSNLEFAVLKERLAELKTYVERIPTIEADLKALQREVSSK